MIKVNINNELQLDMAAINWQGGGMTTGWQQIFFLKKLPSGDLVFTVHN